MSYQNKFEIFLSSWCVFIIGIHKMLMMNKNNEREVVGQPPLVFGGQRVERSSGGKTEGGSHTGPMGCLLRGNTIKFDDCSVTRSRKEQTHIK